MGESLPESSHGLGEPGQDLRIVRDRGLNDASNDTVLTFGYAEGLDNASMEVWGAARKATRTWEAPGCRKAGRRRAWTVDCTTGFSDAHAVSGWRTYLGESLPESSYGLGEPEQDIRVVRDRAPNDALNDIVLTYGYAKSLGNAPMEVWGRRGRRRGGRIQGYKAGCRRGWTVG